MAHILTITAADGTGVRAVDQGQGRPVLIVHPGLDDGASWHRVALRLARRFRVVRLHRRQYRLDLSAKLPCSIEQEVDDLLTLAQAIGEPVVLVGHSSGAVVALEALAASPSTFAGAVLYEPPIHLQPGEWTAAIDRARTALAAGRPGKAMSIFTHDIVRLPGWAARLIGLFVAAYPRLRAFAPHQIDDAAAINQLGVRLDTYAHIEVATTLLGGDRSPNHLAHRLDALANAVPRAEKIVLHGQGHTANQKAPEAVAQVIESLASKVWR
jgi:pimeloyl-ACP methyl ester carboxylesterase